MTIQFVENQFVDSYDPTIENSKLLIVQNKLLWLWWTYLPPCYNYIFIFNFVFSSLTAFTKPWKVKGQDFELKLVDTAGQDEYAIFPAQHSMDMHGKIDLIVKFICKLWRVVIILLFLGYVLVYSITSLQSFELLTVLLEKVVKFRIHEFVFCW